MRAPVGTGQPDHSAEIAVSHWRAAEKRREHAAVMRLIGGEPQYASRLPQPQRCDAPHMTIHLEKIHRQVPAPMPGYERVRAIGRRQHNRADPTWQQLRYLLAQHLPVAKVQETQDQRALICYR